MRGPTRATAGATLVVALLTASCSDDETTSSTTSSTSGSGGSGASGTGGGSAGGAQGGGGAAPCTPDGWTTYGHDARRTFAACASVTAAPTLAWRTQPAPPPGRDFQEIHRAIADDQAVYVNWSATIPPYIGTTAVDRIDPTGARVWTFDSGTDANFGNWMSLGAGRVVAVDDAIFSLDAATGPTGTQTSVDYWGQTLFDGTRFYLANVAQADGPGLFVGGFDGELTFAWKKNEFAQCGADPSDQAGGIALDGGKLFYAPRYTFTNVTPPFESGVYAFDPATGEPGWFVAASPTTPLSAGDGRLYLVLDGTRLVALSQADGSTLWEHAVQSPTAQAPVLIDGLVVEATSAGLVAVHATDGSLAWEKPATLGFGPQLFTVGNACSGCSVLVQVTYVAAARASHTLVVANGSSLEVRDVATGDTVGAYAHPDGKTFRDPIVVPGRIYATDGEDLFALDAM